MVCFFVDTDGNAWDLIPDILDCGINGLLPCEVAAGMDVRSLREEYTDLNLMGGIDKRVLVEGIGQTDRDVDRCFDVAWRGGRYLPNLDHRAPPDISWSTIKHYARPCHELARIDSSGRSSYHN